MELIYKENILTKIMRAKRIQRAFTTRIRFYTDESSREFSSKWNLVTIRDLSSSGFIFNYNKKIPLRTVLEFRMSLPFSEDINCLGRVCRIASPEASRSIKKIPVFGIAVNFIELDDQIKDSIDVYAKMFGTEI